MAAGSTGIRTSLLAIAVALWSAASVNGAIVHPLLGGSNTSVPTATPSVANVGYMDNGNQLVPQGSAVYLGNGWGITAYHVYNVINNSTNRTTVRFVLPSATNTPATATPYTLAPDVNGLFSMLTSKDQYGNTVNADMRLFRLEQDPGLPSLHFGTSPALGTAITFAGAGYRSSTLRQYWRTNPAPSPGLSEVELRNWLESHTWLSSSAASALKAGYYWDGGGGMGTRRWAQNVTSTVSWTNNRTGVVELSSLYTKTPVFAARFDDYGAGGVANEGIVASGDSGGGAFAGNRLIGLSLYLDNYAGGTEAVGQPGGTAAIGNDSLFGDLSQYVDQIARITGLKPSIDGDFTLDGIVNFDDLVIVAQNYQTTLAEAAWTQGDNNLDGVVNFDDLTAVAQNYGMTDPLGAPLASGFASDWALAQSSVPEPGIVLSIVFGGLMLLRRSRRQTADRGAT